MPDREPISTSGAPPAGGPYSQAIRTENLVFVAGQLGLDPVTGEFVAGDVAGQAERALANVATILDAAGSGLDRLVKVTVFLADIGDWPIVNDVYARIVPEPFPARSAFAVNALPMGALVEIEAIAATGSG